MIVASGGPKEYGKLPRKKSPTKGRTKPGKSAYDPVSAFVGACVKCWIKTSGVGNGSLAPKIVNDHTTNML